MTPRDSAIYKRMSAIMRFAGGHMHGGSAQSDDAPSKRALLRSSRWRPYTPRIHASNGPAFASTWESNTGDGEVFINIVSFGKKIWASGPGKQCTQALAGCWPVKDDPAKCATCEAKQQQHLHASGCTEHDIATYCQKSPSAFAPAWFYLDAKYSSSNGYRLFDCYRGVELHLPASAGQRVPVSFALEASIDGSTQIRSDANVPTGLSGFSGLLLTKSNDDALHKFLTRMKSLTALPLGSLPRGSELQNGHLPPKLWSFFPECNASLCAGLTQLMVPIQPTNNYTTPPKQGGDMVSVPGGVKYFFQSAGLEIEGNSAVGAGVQMPWESSPMNMHSQ
eukprot:COSAG05_NODE_2170_length_3442_cov_3.273706_4_plen_336_part_00